MARVSGAGRRDVALRVLTGPVASPAPQVLRGPSIRIGAQAGPGGLVLAGVRGLQPVHCMLTANPDGSTAVAPIGTNPVRLAPHPQVDWSTIEPLAGPAWLSDGCALHLGPVHHGATVQFLGSRPLGEWQTGAIRSGDAGLQSSRLVTTSTPAWVLGCLFLTLGSTTAALLVLGAFLWLTKPFVSAGEQVEVAWFDSVPFDATPPEQLMDGLHAPLAAFVFTPDREAAAGAFPELDDPARWDPRFVRYVVSSVERHAQQRAFFATLERRRREYARVVQALRDAGLPEVFAAIPYHESRFAEGAVSPVCAAGPWQFMPEVAHRVDTRLGVPFRVSGCRLRGGGTFTPTELAPPDTATSVYVEEEGCRIVACAEDDRPDLDRSTAAAVATLREAWENPEIRASGAAVQATILSHNAGLDDAPYLGRPRGTNVLPALRRWVAREGADQGPGFYGGQILCPDHRGRDRCSSGLMPETQHYAYNVVAQHLLAVCFYAQGHGNEPAFSDWTVWLEPGGYCSGLDIPLPGELD